MGAFKSAEKGIVTKKGYQATQKTIDIQNAYSF